MSEKSKDPYTRPEDKRYTLRIDAGMFETIEWCAKKHRRSIAKEIEYALDYYLDALAMMGELRNENDAPYSLLLEKPIDEKRWEEFREIIKEKEKKDAITEKRFTREEILRNKKSDE